MNSLDQLVDAELAEASSKTLRADGPLIDVELYFKCGVAAADSMLTSGKSAPGKRILSE